MRKPVFEFLFNKVRPVTEVFSYGSCKIFNTNEAGLFKGSFFLGEERGVSLTSPFIFQKELISYQYKFVQLLNNLFKVG